MKTCRCLSPALILLFFISLVFAQETSEKLKTSQNRSDLKSLVRCAKIKIALYQYDLRMRRDIKYSEKQLMTLKNKRKSIKRIVEKLEFIAKARQRENNQRRLLGVSAKRRKQPKPGNLRE